MENIRLFTNLVSAVFLLTWLEVVMKSDKVDSVRLVRTLKAGLLKGI